MKTTLIALVSILCSYSLVAHVTPSGGSRETPLRQGSRVTITWDSTRVSSPVTIALWDGERRVLTRIHRAYAADLASYEWEIPDTLPAGQLYRFVVSSDASPASGHYSDSFVAITANQPRVSRVESEAVVPTPTVSPLPAHAIMHVQWGHADAQRIVLTTLVGGEVASWECSSGATQADIDVSAVVPGVYMLVVHPTRGTATSRPVMIQH